MRYASVYMRVTRALTSAVPTGPSHEPTRRRLKSSPRTSLDTDPTYILEHVRHYFQTTHIEKLFVRSEGA